MRFHMTTIDDDGNIAEAKWEMPSYPDCKEEHHALIDVPRALALLAASGQANYAAWLRAASQRGPVAVHLSSYWASANGV